MTQPQIWKLLIAVFMIATYLPVYRFRNNKYFRFFLILSLIDPIYCIIRYTFNIYDYNYLPLAAVIMFIGLPTKETKIKFFSFVLIIVLMPNLGRDRILELLIIEGVFCYMIYFFWEEIKLTYEQTNRPPLFILLLIIFTIINAVKLYLFYTNVEVLTNFFTLFLIVGILIAIIIFIIGPEFQIQLNFKTINPTSQHQNLTVIHNINNELAYKNYENILPKDITKTEIRVLFEISKGLKSQEISDKLYVSRKTVYFHCNNLKAKLDYKTMNQLVKFAVENSSYLEQKIDAGNNTSKKIMKTIKKTS